MKRYTVEDLRKAPPDYPEYIEVAGKQLCVACGYERRPGDWPVCGPDGHVDGTFGYEPFDSYVDADILPRKDPRCTEINEAGRRGIRIESRSHRKQLMKELGLQFGGSREV